jgi:hypothetical protein
MIVALGFGPPPVDEDDEEAPTEPEEHVPGIEDLLVGSGAGRPDLGRPALGG